MGCDQRFTPFSDANNLCAMQLIRILGSIFKVFFYKITALVVACGVAYLISKIIGQSESFDKIGLFSLFFITIYFLVFSMSWAIVYVALKGISKNRLNVFTILIAWLFFYALVFLMIEDGPSYLYTHFSLLDWTFMIGKKVLVTLPALGLFLLFVRKDFVKFSDSALKNKDASIIDADL
ncbi:MAG: hypothetical protein ACI81P_002749 [Neolewinella sp.]